MPHLRTMVHNGRDVLVSMDYDEDLIRKLLGQLSCYTDVLIWVGDGDPVLWFTHVTEPNGENDWFAFAWDENTVGVGKPYMLQPMPESEHWQKVKKEGD